MILVLIISLIFTMLNSLALIVYKIQQPVNTIYIGITHWYEDYFFYLSHLTQGAMGAWLTGNSFTTEAIPQTLIWWYNIILGKIVGLTGLYPWLVYDASVVILSFLYIILMYLVLQALFLNNKVRAIISLLIALVSTNFFTISTNPPAITPITYFYAYTTAFNRLGGVSHLIAQNILSLLVIYTYSQFIQSPVWKWTVLIVLSFTFLFIIAPVYFLVDTLVIFLGLVYFGNLKLFTPLLFSLATALPIVIHEKQAFSHFFYQWMRSWETSFAPVAPLTLLLSMGAVVPLVFVGLKSFFSVKSPLRIFGGLFAFAPILIYFSTLPALFKLPVFRFLQPPAYVFLGAMSYLGVIAIGNLFKKNLRAWVAAGILAGFFLLQLPPLAIELKEKISSYYLPSPLNYLNKDIYKGLASLKDKQDYRVVLATNNLEFFVPVITGLTTYSAHRTLTYDYDRKVKEVFDFYSGFMKEGQAQEFLTKNNIGYILWNKQDGPNDLNRFYPFLEVFHENPGLFIFVPKK